MKSFVVAIASLFVASAAASCAYPPREALSNSWVGLSVERRAKLSPVVFHGLAVETYPPMTSDAPSKGFHYAAQFWLISVYKSARELASFFGTGPPVNGVYDIRDRLTEGITRIKWEERGSRGSPFQCGPTYVEVETGGTDTVTVA